MNSICRNLVCGVRISALSLLLASGSAQAVTFDFLTNDGGFTPTANGTSGFTWASGQGWSTPGQDSVATNTLISPILFVQSNGFISISLSHRYNFEGLEQLGYDGGQLLYGFGGNFFTPLPGTDFSANGYNFLIDTTELSPIAGQEAWSSVSDGYDNNQYITSTAILPVSLSMGEQVQIQLLGAWDRSEVYTSPNWQSQSVTVSNAELTPVVAVPLETDALPVAVAGLFMAGGFWWKRKRTQGREL